jgi:hypothetical protein
MALSVETGTGASTSDSYISLVAAATYHTDRGNTAWAALASDAVREQCLRKATDYMVGAYRQRWKGVRLNATQALDWPRFNVYLEPVLNGAVSDYPYLVASNIVPVEVQRACAELALKAATATLLDDTSQQVIREKVGPIEVEYDKYSSQNTKYSFVESLLAPYFSTTSGIVHKVVR